MIQPSEQAERSASGSNSEDDLQRSRAALRLALQAAKESRRHAAPWLEDLERDPKPLLDAISWLGEHGPAAGSLKVAADFLTFSLERGKTTAPGGAGGAAGNQRALGAAEKASRASLARGSESLRALWSECRRVAPRVKARERRAATLVRQAQIAINEGKLIQAARLYSHALGYFLALGDHPAAAECSKGLELASAELASTTIPMLALFDRPDAQRLSAREMEVAEGIARGQSDREIAAVLALNEKSVSSHARSIRSKLGLVDRAQIGLWYMRNHGS